MIGAASGQFGVITDFNTSYQIEGALLRSDVVDIYLLHAFQHGPLALTHLFFTFLFQLLSFFLRNQPSMSKSDNSILIQLSTALAPPPVFIFTRLSCKKPREWPSM